MKMRTIDQAVADMHAHDPETALTKTALRRLVVSGAIPSTRIGIKYIIDEEKIEELLSSGGIGQSTPTLCGAVRHIS